MYNEYEKALEAAKVIREYCKSKQRCMDCIFSAQKEKPGWGFYCVVRDREVPERWDLTEAERKCAEVKDSVCGTTGLKCVRCNPGACDHRRESNDNGRAV